MIMERLQQGPVKMKLLKGASLLLFLGLGVLFCCFLYCLFRNGGAGWTAKTTFRFQNFLAMEEDSSTCQKIFCLKVTKKRSDTFGHTAA